MAWKFLSTAIAFLLVGIATAMGQTFSSGAPREFAISAADRAHDRYPSEIDTSSCIPAAFFQIQDKVGQCEDCEDIPASWMCSQSHGFYAFVGYEAFRGISDGDWENNGINTGANFGTRLGAISDFTGVGFQIGASAGAYDWSGAGYRLSGADQAEGQGYLTYGFFHKPNQHSNWSAGVVQDWMFNTSYGQFGQNVTFNQWRVQVGYAWTDTTEWGLWGAWRDETISRFLSGVGEVEWRPVNQVSAYWHHKWFDGGPDSSLWIGVPERAKLGGNGSLGDYLAGTTTTAPLTDRLAVYMQVTYMHPSARAGDAGGNEDAWDFIVGLAFYPGRNTRSAPVWGNQWMPLLPVANNGVFLIDSNR